MRYVAVRNWAHYQHKDLFKKSRGRPPWIKFYRDLLEDQDLLELPYAAQLLFDRLLLLAASQRNAIRSDSEWIANKVGMRSQDVAESLPLLLKGAWLSETKTARRSQLIRNKGAPVGAAKEKESTNFATLVSNKENPPTPLSPELRAVYEHWRTARGRTDARYSTISEARRKKIASRLREFNAAELIQAIDGVANDPWDERPQHDDLTTIFRSQEQVERFLEFATNPPRKAGGLSAQDIFDLDLGGDDDDDQAGANANGHALRSLPAATS